MKNKSSKFGFSRASFLALGVALGLTLTVQADLKPSSYQSNGNLIYSPFGLQSREPPSDASSVIILDAQIGLEAQQVCGYTDWTTAKLILPKKLLTADYWNKVGQSLKQKAIQSAMDITAALPSMLACNVSPTYCHILNQAELMANFENQLTFDTCKMLDGAANVSALQSEQLKNCVRENTSPPNRMSASEAREFCIVNDNQEATSKEDKIANSDKHSGVDDAPGRFKMKKLLQSMCPENNDQYHTAFSRGGHAYTRNRRVCRYAEQIFPGLEFSGRASLVRGGTFQRNLEDPFRTNARKAINFLYTALKTMETQAVNGANPGQILRMKHVRDLWEDKANWKMVDESDNGYTYNLPPPIYRPTNDNTAPAFLVSPEQIITLLNLVPKGSSVESEATSSANTPLKQAVDRLSQATAYVQVSDMLADLYTRTLDSCTRVPEFQSALAQQNCKLMLDRTKSEIEINDSKRRSEEQARVAQAEINSIVRDFRREKANSGLQQGSSPDMPTRSGVEAPGTF